jgi:hypothetical protein
MDYPTHPASLDIEDLPLGVKEILAVGFERLVGVGCLEPEYLVGGER